MFRIFDVLTDPELSEEWEKLQTKHATLAFMANHAADEKLSAKADEELDELNAEIETLKDKVAAAARTIKVQRLAPKQYARLLAANPPRPDDEYDMQVGFNTDTFDSALMNQSIVEVTDGNGIQQKEWDWNELAEQMSFAEYQSIIGSVLNMYEGRESVPFSLSDYRKTRS